MKLQKKLLVAALFGPMSTFGANLQVTSAIDDGTGASEGSLSWAILQANDTPEDDIITLTTDIQITQVMKRLVDSNITIQSDSTHRTVNGNGQFRPLFIKSGQVTIQNIDFIDGLAKGGDSGIGGAGAGLGGSIFIYDGDVTISNVTISNSHARGGNATGLLTDGDGGGGMYGNAALNLGSGGLFGTPYGGYGNYRDNDSWFGGHRNGWYGGEGGFGGGGTYGGYEDFGGYQGGFGGGGGAGADGFGYHGSGASGGFGAGKGSTYFVGSISPTYSAGEGGSGFGGAIFIRTGNVLLSNVTIQNNTASSDQGKGLGGGLFILSSLTNLSSANNQGMPDQLPSVTACELNFSDNISSTDSNIFNNSDDLFDEANIINASSNLPADSPCIFVSGNNQLIKSGDLSPNTADSTNFGVLDTNNSQSITQNFTINNLGLIDVHLTGNPLVTISGPDDVDFVVSNFPSSSILQGQSALSFEVTFNPASLGISTAFVNIGFNTSELYTFQVTGQSIDQAAEIEIRGNGQTILNSQLEVSTSDNTLFSGVSNKTFEIHNMGNIDLNLINNPSVNLVGADASDYQIINQPSSSVIGSNMFDTFEIRFSPDVPGIKTAKVEVFNSDSDEASYTFSIEGELIPIMKVYGSNQLLTNGSSNVLELPDVRTDNSYTSSTRLRIINAGNSTLNFDQVLAFQITGLDNDDFSTSYWVQPPLSNSFLPPGAEGNLAILFNPTLNTVRNAVLNIYTDDYYNNHFQYPISGFGNLSFSVNAQNSLIDEGSDLSFDVSLDISGINDVEPFGFDIPFDYFISGSGVGPSDFDGTPLTGQFILPAGQFSTNTISFPTVIDGIDEGIENLRIRIRSSHPMIESKTRTWAFTLKDFDDNDVILKTGFED